MSAEALFAPFSFKSLKLANRVVMAPMTRSFSPGGVATRDVADYYARRAAADRPGVGRPAHALTPASPGPWVG